MDTMTMTSNFNGNSLAKGIEDRFTAAVNVIRGLPKNGKYFNEYTFTTYVYLRKISRKGNENRPSGDYVKTLA